MRSCGRDTEKLNKIVSTFVSHIKDQMHVVDRVDNAFNTSESSFRAFL